jgi:hypothetical protein
MFLHFSLFCDKKVTTFKNYPSGKNIDCMSVMHSQSEFLQNLVKDKKIHEARAFNFTYRYIDDVLSINNPRFAEFLPLIYPPELEIKETTYTASSASCLDLYLEFDDSGQHSTKIYDKGDDFNFKIKTFPNM